jgi:hypothetical protein
MGGKDPEVTKIDNRGKFLLDATVAPQNIRSNRSKLLGAASKKRERLI